jgi:hypothetical protein
MNNLLFSEKPLPKIALDLDGVTIERIARLPMYMQNIEYTVGVAKNKGKQYVRVKLYKGAYANRAGVIFAEAYMDAPMLVEKAELGIPLTIWRFSDLHDSWIAAEHRAEWLKHIEYPWANTIQAVFEKVIAHNDSWDDKDSRLERQWLNLARAAEVAMGRANKFKPVLYSTHFESALLDLYPNMQVRTQVGAAQYWLQNP